MANIVRYLTGFEGWPTGTVSTSGGGLSSGITGTPTVGSTYARPGSGAQGLQCNPVGVPDESWNGPANAGQAVAALSVWVKPVTLDASTIYLVAVVGNSGFAQYGGIGVDGSGNWCFSWSDVVSRATGPPVVTGVWHLLEVLVDMHANPWTARWRVDGVEQTVPTSSATALSTFSAIALGAFGFGNRTVEFWFDDAIAVDGTDQSMFPIGPVTIQGLFPAGAGEHQSITLTQWQTTSDFSSFANFTASNESTSAPLLDDLNTTDGIRMNSATSQAGNARWSLADPSPAQAVAPLGMRGIVTSRDASAGTNNLTARILLGASTTNIYNADPGSTTWVYLAATLARPGGGSWTQSDPASLKVELDSTDASPAVWVGGICIEVAWPLAKSQPRRISAANQTDPSRSVCV